MVKVRKSKVDPPCSGECPLSDCMRLIAGAWAPHVIWYLRAGPRRFSELKGDIRAVSAKVLAERLRQLEADGVVHRQVMQTSPPTVEYSLTALGLELAQAFGQDLGADGADVALQLTETTRACAQVPDHVRRPGAGDQAHAVGQRALAGAGRGDLALADLDHGGTIGMVTARKPDFSGFRK
jgi:DNA-binding HxlR family transcriptional regulator